MQEEWKLVHFNLVKWGYIDAAMAIAETASVPIELLLSRRRTQVVAGARRALYRCLREKGLSLPEIGSIMNRDHTTIIWGLRPRGAKKNGDRSSTVMMMRVA